MKRRTGMLILWILFANSTEPIGLIEPKRRKLDPAQSGITIGIDMSFDDHMLEKVHEELSC